MIDYKTGLRYCADDEEFYQSIREDFAQDSTGRIGRLESLFAELCAGNLSRCRLEVHSLKAIAKQIGAMTLSEYAEAHQRAAEAGDIDYIRSHCGELLAEYRATVAEIQFISDGFSEKKEQ